MVIYTLELRALLSVYTIGHQPSLTRHGSGEYRQSLAFACMEHIHGHSTDSMVYETKLRTDDGGGA